MKRPRSLSIVLFICCALALFSVGCGGDSDSGTPVSIVGTWLFIGTQAGYPPITGTATFSEDGTVQSNYPGTYTVDGNQITMTGGIFSTTTMTGTITGNTMSGTWINSKGTSGSWTATKIS